MDFVCLNYNNQEENNDQYFNTSPVVVIEIPGLAGTSTNTSIETPNNILLNNNLNVPSNDI